MYSLYVHVNKTNHKAYFGITSRKPEARWANGRGYIQNAHFYSAIKKYGWDGFNHVVIRTGMTKEEACERERACIADFDTANPLSGYNNDLGGFANGKMSEATKRKLSESHKRLFLDPARRVEMSKRQLQRFKNPEQREKLSKIHRKRWENPDAHIKASKVQKDSFARNPDRRKNLSTAHLEYYRSHPEARQQKEIAVAQIALDGSLVAVWDSAKKAAEHGNFHRGHISSVCKGKLKQHGGYIWRYASEL